jgi:hypothetical protein
MATPALGILFPQVDLLLQAVAEEYRKVSFVGTDSPFGRLRINPEQKTFQIRRHIEGWQVANVVNHKSNSEGDAIRLGAIGLTSDPNVSVDPRSLFVPHFVQLTAHDIKLAAEYRRTNESAYRNDGSQAYHPAIASIYSINKRLFGYSSLAVFVATYCGIFLLFSFDLGSRTSIRWFNRSILSRSSPRTRIAAGGLFIVVAAFCAHQAISLIFF